MKQGTLEKIQNLAVSLQLVTVEDMQKHSLPQLVTMIANKLNELMNEVHRFESDVIEMVETQNENIQYLLGEGLHLEVATVFEGWMEDGTFDTLINQSALKQVNNRIDETNAQLSITNQQVALKASASDVTTLDEVKANTVDVDRKINAVASGSPREAFATVDDLKDKYPDGNSNIYLVSSDGHWYFYDDEWKSGGVYQSMQVQDRSIGIDQLNVIYRRGIIISGGINVNFDSDILEIESDTVVSDLTGFYSCSNADNILLNSDKYPRYIYFNTDTRLFHVEARWFRDNPKELLVCCYYNKKIFGISNNDLIKANGKHLKYNGQIDYDMINDSAIRKNHLWFSYTHGCIIYGGFDIDLNDKTISITSGTVVSDLTGFYSVANSNTTSTFDVDTNYPIYIYFNISTSQIHVEARWYSYSANELLLCTIYKGEVYNTLCRSSITLNGGKNISGDFSWTGKKFVSYGDSITQGNTWQNYLVNELGLVHENHGLSSSCISNFEQWAVSMSNNSRIDAIPLDADIITIMGGTNDWASRRQIGTLDDVTTETFIGGYKHLIERLMSRIPNARIIIMSPPFGYYNTGVGSEEVNGIGIKLSSYIEASELIAKHYKLPFINMYQDLGINKFNKDNFMHVEDLQVHPNSNGGKRVAGRVLGELRKLNN